MIPIAVVGIGCRFPGADGPEAFWRLLADGSDAITEVPPSRFDVDAVYDPAPGSPGKMATRWGGFLPHVEEFDAAFFNISPREALRMDPQQRLLLEVSWEALEDAGVVVGRMGDRRAGVIVGLCNSDFWTLQCGHPSSLDVYVNVGSNPSVAAGRLSYALGFEGPSVSVNTACSSSLVAIHLACQSLRTGEAPLALAGGVNLVLTPEVSISFSQAGMLAPDGRCKSFDARANGFVRSDGVGMVVLRRLEDAVAGGDRIYAVILGSAVNNDGRSGDLLMTPSRSGQEAVLRAAYASAGVDPSRVRYVEAHGTGTAVGDPIEVGALAAVLAPNRVRPCSIGSLKANIGHTEAAAGVAGLIKVALALQRRTLPPSIHCETPTPAIPWDDLPLTVQRKLQPLPEGEGEIIAGVSSFGIAGTNGHLVVGEAPPVPEDAAAPRPPQAQLLALSADSGEGLVALARAHRAALSSSAAALLADLCYTAGARRTHHGHRAAFVAAGREQLLESLEAFLRAPAEGVRAAAAPAVVFVFPGQGAQWPAMGRELFQEDAFRRAVERCDAAMRGHVDWSLIEVLTQESHPRAEDIDVVQPATFAMQVALGQLWRSWGIEPKAVIGQSMGEIAACHLAGALGLEDAARLICLRSRLLRRVSGRGAMAVVALPMDRVQLLLRAVQDRVSIAVSHSPGSTVLSGDLPALLELQDACEKRDVLFRLIKVDVASHSPQMDPLLPELRELLGGLAPAAARVPIHSTVTGAPIDGRRLDADYWLRNLREPVLFSDALRPLLSAERERHIFVELSPHPLLSTPIQQWIDELGRPARVLPSLRRGESGRMVMLESLGALYEEGVEIDWSGLFPRGGRCVSLPPYPWRRESFPVCRPEWGRAQGQAPGHPLLARSRAIAHPQSWEVTLDGQELSYLRHHCIHQTPLVPAAAWLELALAAADRALGPGPHQLERVVLPEALFLAEEGAPQVRISIDGQSTFQISSRDGAGWRLHAEGAVVPGAPAPPAVRLAEIRGRCPRALTSGDYYRELAERGLEYGPAFRGVAEVHAGSAEALGRVSPAEDSGYAIHPATLDACFQVMFAALPRDVDGDRWLPMRFESVRVHRRAASLWSHAVVRSGSQGDRIEGDLVIFDEGGHVAAEVKGLELRRLDRRPVAPVERLLCEARWEPAPRQGPAPAVGGGPWLLLADEGGVGRAVAERLGEPCVVAFRRDLDPELSPAALLQWLGDRQFRGIVHCWGLDASMSSLDDAQRLGIVSLLAWVQAFAGVRPSPRLFVVTSGVQVVGDERGPVSIAQAPLWGLARTIRLEHPELRCTSIDLGGPDDLPALAEELRSGAVEPELVLRGNRRYARRLARGRIVPRMAGARPLAEGDAFRVQLATPGTLDEVRLRPWSPPAPAAGELRIRVHFVSLNFIDVMRALGIYPGQSPGPTPLGVECAGTVEAVGDGVTGWSPGDEVVAVTPAAVQCLASSVNVPASLAVPRSQALDLEQAATLPMALLTAGYALHHLARLDSSERVLIHAASGGVGLAAVQLARLAGAEIFATCGSEEKRRYLRSLGLARVMDSRSTRFADEVLEQTGGRGVDVVLSSMAGEAARRSLDVVAPFGRFVDLGKRDIHDDRQLGLRALRNNVSYFAVDIDQLLRQRPDRAGPLLTRLLAGAGTGRITSLPSRTFPLAEAAGALRHMAQARHVGRVLVSLRDRAGAFIETDVLRADASYLITGGLGGLGLAVAEWMAGEGARHLVLMGRSAPSPSAEAVLQHIRSSGTRVIVAQGDVSRAEDVARAMTACAPPLRGVIHAAAVLDDGILLHLTPQRLQQVSAPKISGAWNLHTLTAQLPLDFFILFSSAASLLGSAGQGSYVAANAFLDALAWHRHALGLPALSINWGPWSRIGLAAARGPIRGFGSITPGQGLQALGRLMDHAAPQMGVLPLEWKDAPEPAPRPGQLTRQALLGVEAGERPALARQYLLGQLGRVVGMAPARIDPAKPLNRLGLDSLMAVELKNRIEADLGVMVPVVKLLKGLSLAQLSTAVCELAEQDRRADSGEEPAEVPVQVDRLSDTEVDSLLATLLADRGAEP